MTVDLVLFANLSLVLVPKHPNSLLADVIRESAPSLVDFHARLDTLLESTNGYANIPRLAVPPRKTVAQAISSWWTGGSASPENGKSTKKKAKDPRERAFERGRWMWFLGAAGAMVTYLLMSGLVTIQLGADEDVYDEEENEDEEEDAEGEFIEVVDGEDDEDEGEDAGRSPLDGLVEDDDEE